MYWSSKSRSSQSDFLHSGARISMRTSPYTNPTVQNCSRSCFLISLPLNSNVLYAPSALSWRAVLSSAAALSLPKWWHTPSSCSICRTSSSVTASCLRPQLESREPCPMSTRRNRTVEHERANRVQWGPAKMRTHKLNAVSSATLVERDSTLIASIGEAKRRKADAKIL